MSFNVESIIFDVLTSDPGSPVEGQFWYNTTEKRLKSFQGGVIQTSAAKNKEDATVAPTATDDSAAGYSIGSRWVDVTGDNEYVCLDATAASAVWKSTTAGATDSDAIHKSIAAEISTITEKTAPVAADLLLIEDSAAGNAKKRLKVGNIRKKSKEWYVSPTDPLADFTTISAAVAAASSGDIILLSNETHTVSAPIAATARLSLVGVGSDTVDRNPNTSLRRTASLPLVNITDATSSNILNFSAYRNLRITATMDMPGAGNKYLLVPYSTFGVAFDNVEVTFSQGTGTVGGISIYRTNTSDSIIVKNSFFWCAGVNSVKGLVSDLSTNYPIWDLETSTFVKSGGTTGELVAANTATGAQGSINIGQGLVFKDGEFAVNPTSSLHYNILAPVALLGTATMTGFAIETFDSDTAVSNRITSIGALSTSGKNTLFKLNLRELTSGPFDIGNGDVWYDATAAKYKAREGGVTKDVINWPFKGTSGARTWTVHPNEPTADYPTIGAAITAASAGDVILIAPGDYAEKLSITKAIALVGQGSGLQGIGLTRPAVRINPSLVDTESAIAVSGAAGTDVVLSNLYVRPTCAVAGTTYGINLSGSAKLDIVNCTSEGVGLAGATGTMYGLYRSSGNLKVYQSNFTISTTQLGTTWPVYIANGGNHYFYDCHVIKTGVASGNFGVATTGNVWLHNVLIDENLNVASGCNIYASGGTSWGALAGSITDTDTDTILTVRPSGLVHSSGKNDAYKLALRGISGAPGAVASGNIWYDTALNKFRAHENGVSVDLRGGAPSGTASGDLAGTYPSPTVAQASQAWALTGVISPTSIAANTNNYAPTGLSTASRIRLTSSGAFNITGLTGGSTGRIITLFNVGGNNLTLTNEDAASTAANRFTLRGATSFVLTPNKAVDVQYDGTTSRWRVLAASDPYGTAVNTACQGNDSRLSDDRTAAGVRTATTVVAVSSATAPTNGQVLTATSGTAATWQTPAGGTTSKSKSLTIDQPTASEDLTAFFTNAAITISEMRAVVRGSTPSVTWTIRHGTDRSAAGAEVVTGGTTTTSQTAGSDVVTFNDPTVVADSFVWVETTGMSGSVSEFALTIVYTED